LLPKNGQIINKQRFYDEFGEETDVKDGDEAKKQEKEDLKKSRKPEDFEAIFSGNNDDSFRIGISVARRTLRVCTFTIFLLFFLLVIIICIFERQCISSIQDSTCQIF
jgi:preprotein translocase subunit SecG